MGKACVLSLSFRTSPPAYPLHTSLVKTKNERETCHTRPRNPPKKKSHLRENRTCSEQIFLLVPLPTYQNKSAWPALLPLYRSFSANQAATKGRDGCFIDASGCLAKHVLAATQQKGRALYKGLGEGGGQPSYNGVEPITS